MSGIADAVRYERLVAARWRDACATARATGWRFLSLHAASGEARVLFAKDREYRLLACPTTDGAVPTIVDLIGAAEWDEREAHDLHGIRFDGHDPLRPLVRHDLDLSSWTVPVSGAEPHQVAVGPIHAGVIESGHFRFHLVGERVIHLDIRLFYKHRGLERAAEGATLADGIAYAQRACAACAVTNTVAYAQACEVALGLWPDAELARARTLLLELERLYNHLYDISALCAGVGFAPGAMVFLALKERAQRLNAALTGHRFLFGTVAVGTGRISLDGESARIARDELRTLRVEAHRAWRAILFNGSVQDRLDLVGVVDRDAALRLGTVGPAARAAGVDRDVRNESPRLAYTDFRAARPEAAAGDVQRRLELRATELATTFEILDELLAGAVSPGQARLTGDPAPLGAARVESPRGESACVVETEGGAIARFHLRTGSYRNWASVSHAAADNLLPDFPLINKSFELCYACADR
jgi:Ni,Fe-hydrogenase III large subunit